MLIAGDLRGLMAMMPAFAADGASDVKARHTVDANRLHAGVQRMISDGADVLAAAGSFGEFHTLMPDEFRVLANETVAAVKGRVPLFIGATSINSREAFEKMEIVQNAGADGVLLGVPFYFPSTVENALNFFREMAEMFPKLSIMIYHNPALHNVTLPVEVFSELVKIPSIVGMKDSHRDVAQFLKLQKTIAGKISVFVMQQQYFNYANMGAAGFWSIDAWMGPWPLIALRDAVARNDRALSEEITLDLIPPPGPVDLSWRETAAKIAVGMAGYVEPGPLRPPFVKIPAEVAARQTKRVERWKHLCEKYQQKGLGSGRT